MVHDTNTRSRRMYICTVVFADNTKAVVMLASEAYHLVSDALTELVEVFIMTLSLVLV